jgi:hypothetical protein
VYARDVVAARYRFACQVNGEKVSRYKLFFNFNKALLSSDPPRFNLVAFHSIPSVATPPIAPDKHTCRVDSQCLDIRIVSYP